MPEERTNQISLDELENKIKNGEFSFNDFNNYWKQKQQVDKRFLSLLEYAVKQKPDDKNLDQLLRKCTLASISDLMEKLKRLGYSVRKDLGEDFQKMGYRLLEQVRAGKRSDVMYGISRIFISHQRNLPDSLIEAFKPYYDIETFKCLMYSFLSAAIKPKEKNIEEE